MRIGTLDLSGPLVFPPMSGLSDRPCRLLARRFGADLTFCEFISAEGLRRGVRQAARLVDVGDDEHPIGVQLFGDDPTAMAEAARVAQDIGADIVDLNFGCPSRRVVGTNGGSALLRDLPLVARIVSSVVKAVRVPVTAKFRLGFHRRERPVHVPLGRACEQEGASALTLHARYRSDGYGGKAEWERIAELVDAVRVPVIGNGDVSEPEDAWRMLRDTGCEGVAVARGAVGNPWLFFRAKALLRTGSTPPPPSPEERLAVAEEHVRLQVAYRGREVGVPQVRKHVARYVRGLPGASAFRVKALALTDEDELISCIRAYRESLAARARSGDV